MTTDPAHLATCDALFICVPSPLGRNRQPDLSYIEAAAVTVGNAARAGALVVLESTTYPGTTEDVIVPAVESAGLKLDQDVSVAFSPERVNPGGTMNPASIPKVVGGVTALSGEVAAAAYRTMSMSCTSSRRRVQPKWRSCSRTRTGQSTSGSSTRWPTCPRDRHRHLGSDRGGRDKAIRVQAFFPGPGVGGHCIPLDPQYLAWRAREARFTTRFIDVAEQVNISMPSYTADRVAELLNAHGLPILDTAILGVGIAYKPNVADDRESAAIDVLRELRSRGGRITVLDPVVGEARIEERGFAATAER